MNIEHIARITNGRIYRDHVECRAPWRGKDKRRLLHIWPAENGIRTNYFHVDIDQMEAKRRTEAWLGIVWKPQRKAAPRPKPASNKPSLFVIEVLRCLSARPSFEQFALLLNEHRLGHGSKETALTYAARFGFIADDVEHAYASPAHHHNSEEKAAILGITCERRLALKLKTIACIDLDKAGRKRLSDDRRNAGKRARRAAAKAAPKFPLAPATPEPEPPAAVAPELEECARPVGPTHDPVAWGPLHATTLRHPIRPRHE